MNVDENQSPNSVPWPPLILTMAVAASLGLGMFRPLLVLGNLWVWVTAYVVASIGIALDLMDHHDHETGSNKYSPLIKAPPSG